MANALGPYNAIFYAQEALIYLKNALGMAPRVYRDYDPNPASPGDTITIKIPSTFTAQDAPSAAQDVAVGTTSITLDKWKDVRIALTDKELAFSTEKIIQDHIGPAAYTLANRIDTDLNLLYKDVPWYTGAAGTTATTVADILTNRKRMFANKVPFMDKSLLHAEIDGDAEANFLGLQAFAQQQGSGPAGMMAQIEGSLGQRYGFNFFASQNVQTHTKGTASTGTLAVNGTFAAGVSTINLDAGSVTGTLVAGDSFVIAGDTQRYSVTATSTASGNAFTGVTFTPALAAAPADDAVVTVQLHNGVRNLFFHRNAFCLAMRPLSDAGDGIGSSQKTIQDPDTGLAIRSTYFYDGPNAKVNVRLDVLYGVKTLNPNLASIMLG